MPSKATAGACWAFAVVETGKPAPSGSVPSGRTRAPYTSVAVTVRGVSKRFLVRRPFKKMLRHPFRREWAQALNELSCEIRGGEFFGFLGANGAGKTTLFKILATLIIPDQGTVTIEGMDVASRPSEVSP